MEQGVITDYGKARRIYYNFNIGDEEITTKSVRQSLITYINRQRIKDKIFKTKKTGDGYKIWRQQ